MRYLTLGALIVVAGAVTAPGTAAQAPDPRLMAPIQKFVDSFNKGDMTGAAATHMADADLLIIDEVAPFAWHGADAFKTWSAALDSESKKAGITDGAVAVKPPVKSEVNGDLAYLVVPAVYTFKQKGVAMRETAHIAVVLKKGSGGWLLHSWAWTGQKPLAAAAKPKA